MGAAVAAAIIRREKDLVAHFRQAGAISVETAKTSGALGVDGDMAFRRLRARAVIREGAAGSFYLDEQSWEAHERTRQRLGLTILLIVVAVTIAALLSNRG